MSGSSESQYLTERSPPALVRASGATVTILVSAADSGGAIGVIETAFPPGDWVPFRMHSRADETFYVVSGIGEFGLGDTTVVRGPGSIIFGPRDVPLGIAALGEAGNDPRETGAVLQRYGLTRV
jgi:quercetin dioxygenase-like cupin family protein